MMFVEVNLHFTTLPPLCCHPVTVIPLRRSPTTGSRNRRTTLYCRPADSAAAVENPMEPGCPERYGQTE